MACWARCPPSPSSSFSTFTRLLNKLQGAAPIAPPLPPVRLRRAAGLSGGSGRLHASGPVAAPDSKARLVGRASLRSIFAGMQLFDAPPGWSLPLKTPQ